MSKIAIAVFVKNPNLTPVKTRLAKGIGKKEAIEFYERSCQATQEVVAAWSKNTSPKVTIHPYWAIAEAGTKGRAPWREFPFVEQGDGDLGARLDKVYGELRASHDMVMLLGSDSPQIDPGLLDQAVKQSQGADFVIGPARDGGFYLLLGKHRVPRTIWQQTPYSDAKTCGTLVDLLRKAGHTISMMDPLDDIDTSKELFEVKNYLAHLPSKTPGQESLIQWIEAIQSV